MHGGRQWVMTEGCQQHRTALVLRERRPGAHSTRLVGKCDLTFALASSREQADTPLGQGDSHCFWAMAADTGSPLHGVVFPRPVRLFLSAILQVLKVYGDLCSFAFLPHFFIPDPRTEQ